MKTADCQSNRSQLLAGCTCTNFEGAAAQKYTTKPKDSQITEAGLERLHSTAGEERVAILPNGTVQFPQCLYHRYLQTNGTGSFCHGCAELRTTSFVGISE